MRVRSVTALLLPPDVLPHPLGDADHPGLVGRDASALAELVGPVRRWHPPAGELAVPGHEEQGDVADRRPRLDETLDTLAGRDEVLEVLLVVRGRRPHPRRAGARGVAAGTTEPRSTTASEESHDGHDA